MNLHTAGGRAGRLLLAGRLPRYSWHCRSILASLLWPCFNGKQKVLWQQEGTTSASTSSAMAAAPAQTLSATSAWCLCRWPVLLPRVPSGPSPPTATHAGEAAPCCAARHASSWCRCGAGCARIVMWSCLAFVPFELCCSLVDSSPIRSCPNISRRSSSSLRGCRVVGRDVHVMVLRYQHHCKGEQEEVCRVGLLAGSGVRDECTGAGRRINWCTSNGCRTGACPCPSYPLLLVSGHLGLSRRGWMLHPEHPAQGGSGSSEGRK